MIFNEYLQVNLVGTPHQQAIGVRGLAAIFSGGFITEAQGFWLDDPLESNRIVRCWTNDLDGLAPRIIRFLEAYQRYADQQEVFFEVKTQEYHKAGSIAPEGWSSEGLELLDRGSWLANYFSGGGG